METSTPNTISPRMVLLRTHRSRMAPGWLQSYRWGKGKAVVIDIGNKLSSH